MKSKSHISLWMAWSVAIIRARTWIIVQFSVHSSYRGISYFNTLLHILLRFKKKIKYDISLKERKKERKEREVVANLPYLFSHVCAPN